MNTSQKSPMYPKRLLWMVLMALTFSITDGWAQRRSSEEMQRIQDARTAIITNRLAMTPEQSTEFWPVYNEYSQKRREIHRSQRKIISEKKAAGTTDEQVLSNLKEVQELKQKELDLEKEYQSRFLKVLSASQVAELYKAERTFNEMLLQRLKQRGGNPNSP
ncbi:hypothetical protein GCM10027275_17480 [Rhabdobacter roseus]|uniref:Spy/CpxP family protein refolding chaperone n=1 Tax=Rhabdobacter roseus TaxID=1655419 RepID=A0A840TR13_9BACT|nr:hypothetical protein [Rhabdobacter roseus]MBB5283673.1 Spy/CpxP family protein refolding chaperone [Rhabdobacter roseus]